MVQVTMPSCTITSQTFATVPGVDNSRTSIGVGESVLLTSNAAATWTVASGKGVLTADTEAAIGFPSNAGFPTKQCSTTTSSDPISGSQACFTAPYSTDTSVISATLADGSSCSTKLTTVQPSGLIFQRMQSPPLESPGYIFFDVPPVFYVIGMVSVVFLTPGDVSFANVRIAEHDTNPLVYDPQYNLLFNVSGTDPTGASFSTHAWLLECDRNKDPNALYDTLAHQSYWFFSDRSFGHQTKFSLTRTETHHLSLLGDFYYSKRQIAALTAGGMFEATPDAPASLLTVPRLSLPYRNVQFPNRYKCVEDVEQQFPLESQ